MFDTHTLEVLEFSKIIDLIIGKCLTPYGKDIVRRIGPLDSKEEIIKKGTEISQMKDIINFGQAFPLYRMENCREPLKKSQVTGGFLEPKEILHILELVEASIEIHEYDKEHRENFPTITEYIKQIRSFPELKKSIRRTIDEDGEVRDNASSKLKQIRNELRETKHRILKRLEQIQAAQTKQPGLQDDVVTIRNGRYVISVPSNRYQSNMGILHDRSQTGATLYVEPQETVETNNRLNLLMQEERLEIDRILRALTSEIGKRSEPLLENTRLIGKLDAIHACAVFSNQIKGNQPVIGADASLNLIEARHPLLIMQAEKYDDVIPNSINLDDSRQAVLITGPNTGGKTILLKTVGLTVAMAQAGLHIAADKKSTVGVFNNIFADIGDEQSIELSLSTFSSHLTNIIRAVQSASPQTLLLFDEIGAGTDPKEGAALAESIILYCISKGARLLVTTHYSQLKTLAMENPEIENASLEFDRNTLAPTYRLRLGIPGSSYAVEIAERLGLPQQICIRAAELVGSGEKSLSNLIASLESELAQIRKEKIELTDRLAKAKDLENYYNIQSKKIRDEAAVEKQRLLDETEVYLNETRREIERLVADIRKSQAEPETVKQFHHQLKKQQDKLARFKQSPSSPPPEPGRFDVGDTVEILSLKQQGEITALLSNDRARVKIGNIHTTVDIRNLRKINNGASSSTPAPRPRLLVEETVSPEIHLRGMTSEEALETLDKYLDRAIVAGLTQVYVIHGKGTGTLRRILTRYLKERPEVDSVRLGNWNEGGAGVTIVKLKG